MIQPDDVGCLTLPLSVGHLPGVRKVTEGTEEKLKCLGTNMVQNWRTMDLLSLESPFGRYGVSLYELARGVDNSAVVPDRVTQSISSKIPLRTTRSSRSLSRRIRALAERTWTAVRNELRTARTVVLKL